MVRIKLCGLLFLEVNGASDTIRTCDRWLRGGTVIVLFWENSSPDPFFGGGRCLSYSREAVLQKFLELLI